MVKRIVVGAHYGLSSWLLQRLTAVVMAVYSLVLAFAIVARPPVDRTALRALFAPEWFRVVTLVFLLSLLYHAWVGVRDIVMDYVNPAAARLSLQMLVALALIIYALWSLTFLWSV
jgi:succinate dehydrogenase / fumarate reductase membrane anchor subunit